MPNFVYNIVACKREKILKRTQDPCTFHNKNVSLDILLNPVDFILYTIELTATKI